MNQFNKHAMVHIFPVTAPRLNITTKNKEADCFSLYA